MAFGGALFKSWFAGKFQQEFKMSYVEYSNLNNAKEVYDTTEKVEAALKALRAGKPASVPVSPKPAAPARINRLSANEWCQIIQRGGITLYRAADKTPEEIAAEGAYIKSYSEARRLELIRLLVSDPRAFVRSHISNNLKEVHSCSWNESCMDYCNTRAYVYKLKIPELYEFSYMKPVTSNIMRPPIIWADSPDPTLGSAKQVAWDVQQDGTDEVDLLFPIELDMIEAYKKKGTGNWVVPNWKNLKGPKKG